MIPGPLLGAPDCIVTLSGPYLGHPIGPVAGVGDPDGDGDGDFAFVSWSPLYLLDLAHAASAPYELPGWQQATTQDWLVGSMNSVGDLDGDGIVELAAHDAAAGSTGSIRLISVDAVASGDPAFSQVALTPPVNAWEMILQGSGDADGDGRTDLLVGERTLGGTVCVLTEVPPPGVHALATVGSCWATLPPDQIAWDVSWLPDLDGDGLDEVAASLRLESWEPPTLRVNDPGTEIAVLPALDVDGPDDALIHLPSADLQRGYLAVGDVSGDGLADIVYGGGLILGENLTP